MKRTTNSKGITLISLVMYVMLTIIILSVVGAMTAYFKNNMNNLNVQTSESAEFDKLNLQLLNETKITNNLIDTEQSTESKIVFKNTGNKYKYVNADKSIYFNENIKIAKDIESCKFSIETTEHNQKLIFDGMIKGKQRRTEYIIETNNYIKKPTISVNNNTNPANTQTGKITIRDAQPGIYTINYTWTTNSTPTDWDNTATITVNPGETESSVEVTKNNETGVFYLHAIAIDLKDKDGNKTSPTSFGIFLLETGVKSINIENMILDGASLITATLTNDKIATSEDVTWSSSNSNVATVEANGIVKCGTQTGTAQITCTGLDGTTKTCTVENKAKIVYTNNGTANSTITGATTGFRYNKPIIPVGYSAIDTIDVQWKLTGVQENYNKGLVIMDAKGNQYVWVPVDETTVPYQKWCTTNISHVDCSDDTLSDGTTIASVDTTTTYGGFWIGRYEAGLDVDLGSNYQLTTSRNVTGEPIIVEGAIPWNFIDYTNSRANAESLVNNEYVRSGLINGTQWDTALKWVKSNTSLEVGDGGVSTAWGNYQNTSLTLDRYKPISTNYGASWSSPDSGKTTNGSSQILRTGASTTTKSLNISDLAGNMWEWTNEIYSSNRVSRGGGYYGGSTSGARASYRGSNSAGGTYSDARF